ncbi:MAG: deoxyribodipyrimidine photo-lyase [Campylobacterales bacterium]|nr:deoxyribodipyrimidine photo-lyase [Campylobacterales bacterium]
MRYLLWFRRDLRSEDHPLLSLEGEVLAIFIFDTNILSKLKPDDRRVGMIYAMVSRLREELLALNLPLQLYFGDPVAIIEELHVSHRFDAVCASQDFDAYALERDRKVSHLLSFHTLRDPYLFDPNEMLKSDATPYLVFTPFYKELQRRYTPQRHQAYTPAAQRSLVLTCNAMPTLASMGFTCKAMPPPDPSTLLEVLTCKLSEYSVLRDRLDADATSHLSVALRFGLISIRAVVRHLLTCKGLGIETEGFFRQLIFREFYAHMLYHFPRLERENFRHSFGGVADEEKFKRFCSAQTGVPIVDASVRELLQTGTMHNRARMIAASFFTKDLLLPWQWGERFFAAHLSDYDASANILSWQWSAGTGIDPQPYFRIFNPYLQAKKFDPDARYIKRWCPELLHVSPKNLHDEAWLQAHTISSYPKPMVDHKSAAAEAIRLFQH